jgi:hypothetical protein
MSKLFALAGSLIFVAAVALSASQPRSNKLYAVRAPMDFRGAKAQFEPGQMVWVLPLIRTFGCTFAQNVVRNHLEPAVVSFDSCSSGKIDSTLDDNLIDITVSGIAVVNGVERTFKVTLQHYPPSTSEEGFIATSVEVR